MTTDTFIPCLPPHLTIPDIGVKTTSTGRLAFTIATPKGDIRTESSGIAYRRNWIWICSGSVDALSEYGLILPEWCPGLPGNNKTAQTVLYTANGPQLFRGNPRGNTFHWPSISIKKTGAKLFSVHLPVSPEQEKRLEDESTLCWKNLEERRESEHKSNAEASRLALKTKLRARSKNELLEDLKDLVGGYERILMDNIAESAYVLNPSAEQAIKQDFERLRHWLQTGLTPLAKPEILPGNVVPLRRGVYQ